MDCSNKIILILKETKKFEIKCYLSGESDHLDIYMEIHAGAGGTDAQDWADLLLRLYQRWIEKKGFTSEVVDYSSGDEAGIKSVTLIFFISFSSYSVILQKKEFEKLISKLSLKITIPS